MTALVAGDIVASEDAGSTLKMILTRSLKRSQVLAGKTLASFTYTLALLVALLAAALVSGLIAWGYNPVTDISHTRISATHALGLSFAALGVFAIPLIAIAAFAIFLSVATRNSAAAIVGTLVYALAQEALAGLVHLDFFRHYLLSDQFDGWHGLFQTPTYWTPIIRAHLGLRDLHRHPARRRLRDLPPPRRRRRVAQLGAAEDGEHDPDPEQRSADDIGEPVHLKIGAAPRHPEDSQRREPPPPAPARSRRREQ